MDDYSGPIEVELALIQDAQARAGGLKAAQVNRLAKRYQTGEPVDAGVVMFDGEVYWGADVHHRKAAAQAAGLSTLLVFVMPGGQDEAREYGGRVNGKREHAARWTHADMHAQYDWLKTRPNWQNKTSAELAEACGATDRAVEKWRKADGDTGHVRLRRDGKVLPPRRAQAPEARAKQLASVIARRMDDTAKPVDDLWTAIQSLAKTTLEMMGLVTQVQECRAEQYVIATELLQLATQAIRDRTPLLPRARHPKRPAASGEPRVLFTPPPTLQ